MRTYIKLFIILMILSFSFLAMNVFAAEIILDIPKKEFAVGEEFPVDIFLGTQDSLINAIEGELIFPRDLLEIKEIRDGSSIMNFWLERPSTHLASTTFSGITPGGYRGDRGFLFTVVFKTKEPGAGNILLKNVQLLQNNISSSKSAVQIKSVPIAVSKENATGSPLLSSDDSDMPESFTGEIEINDQIFEGKPFLVFATQDKGSGIDHYEVKEGFWGKYVTASSPYVLQNEKLDKKIYIKAFDKRNNIRLSIVYPSGWQPWYTKYRSALVFGIVLLVFFGVYLERRKA